MAVEAKITRILRLYPDDCQAQAIEPLHPADSFSGATLWRVQCPRGTLCLRRLPADHPTPERLQFIQAVLWHVDQEGFTRVPLPIETRHHHGFVRHDGRLWELTPWLPGEADYRRSPSPEKLRNALIALAQFHEAAHSFPLPETGPAPSPSMAERVGRLQALLAGGLDSLREAAASGWPELSARAARLIGLVQATAGKVLPTLEGAGRLEVSLQPCIRDIWHAHVLFQQDAVSGIVDFGSMRPESVAADVARLLGSLALDHQADWQAGLSAYETIRPLSADELALVRAFDRSNVLLGGLQWLEWIYLEQRHFENRAGVLARVDEFVGRLETLAQGVC